MNNLRASPIDNRHENEKKKEKKITRNFRPTYLRDIIPVDGTSRWRKKRKIKRNCENEMSACKRMFIAVGTKEMKRWTQRQQCQSHSNRVNYVISWWDLHTYTHTRVRLFIEQKIDIVDVRRTNEFVAAALRRHCFRQAKCNGENQKDHRLNGELQTQMQRNFHWIEDVDIFDKRRNKRPTTNAKVVSIRRKQSKESKENIKHTQNEGKRE